MGRTRTIPDSTIYASILRLLEEGGEKAVSFGTVAAATGLAASSLVQRYSDRTGMMRAARLAAWAVLEARTAEAIAQTSEKGAAALLKALGKPEVQWLSRDLHDPETRARAMAWRTGVEAMLSLRLGGGPKAREAAAVLFAAWQGQALWEAEADADFRLKDVAKRLI
jgi:hypothetical protein